MVRVLIYIVIFLIAVIISVILKLRKGKKDNSYENELRAKGKRIPVPLQDCEVKSNSFHEAVDTSDEIPSRAGMLDALYDSNRSYKEVHRTLSVVIYKHQHPSGKLFEFRSKVYEMPVENLRYLMEQRMEGAVYVDEQNWNRYFFDLGF